MTYYTGSCHCGAVHYEVDATIDKAMECNCSICSKKGSLMAFVPANAFHLLQGKEALTDYQFNKKSSTIIFANIAALVHLAVELHQTERKWWR